MPKIKAKESPPKINAKGSRVRKPLGDSLGGRDVPPSHGVLAVMIEEAVEKALSGDPDYGLFVGELVGWLNKKRPFLSKANKTFEDCVSAVDSARAETVRSSGLRKEIQEIIEQAKYKRRLFVLEKLSWDEERRRAREPRSLVDELVYPPGAPERPAFEVDKELANLPELTKADDVVDKWTKLLVLPAIRRRESELAKDPKIGKLPKAQKDGKFQVTPALEKAIRKDVQRIAAMEETLKRATISKFIHPRPSYFKL